MTARAGRIALVAFAALVVVAPVLGLAAPAQAHNYLVSSDPSAGQVLTSLPEHYAITTNDDLLDLQKNNAGFAIQVQDAKGRYYGDGCVAVSGPSMTTDAAIGAPGRYTVTWQVISTDGHPVSDDFAFEWKPSGDVTPSRGSATAPDCHGTIHPNGTGATSADPRDARVGDDVLATVLWIGGAVLAVGVAVIVTLLLTSRRRGR